MGKTHPAFLMLIVVCFAYIAEWIECGGIFEILIDYVCVDHGSIEVLMSKNFFERSHVNSVLIHQGSGSMPELVYRQFLIGQACLSQMYFYQMFDGLFVDPLSQSADKQCILVSDFGRDTYGHVFFDCIETYITEIDNTFFVAFAQNAEPVFGYITEIYAHELGDTQSACQKQHYNAVIPLFVPTFNRVEKLQ